MLPNKLVPYTLVALLALPALAGSVDAQGLGTGADLKVTAVDVSPPRIAEIAAPINVTITNVGTENFNSATGWMIFVGLNGLTKDKCIEESTGGNIPNTGPQPGTSPCFIMVVPGSGNPLNIAKGKSETYSLMWTAENDDATTNVTSNVRVEILPLGSDPGTNACGPDTSNCANNDEFTVSVFIAELGVRAIPDREPSPSANGDKNEPWTQAEMLNAPRCPIDTDSPNHIQKACLARPGTTLVARYLVRNVGTIDDSYNGQVRGLTDERKAGGYVYTVSPQNFSLAPQQEIPVFVTMFIPLNATANNATNVNTPTETVRWTSLRGATHTDDDDNPGCDQGEFSLYCDDPTIPTYKVDFRRASNITANFTWTEVRPGASTTYLLNITNDGNANDRFNVTFVEQSRDIDVNWSPTISVPAGHNESGIEPAKNGTWTIQVRPPDDTRLQLTRNGTYYFDVRIKSFNDEAAPCKLNQPGPGVLPITTRGDGECIIRLYTHVKQQWHIFPVSDAPARVVPGTTIPYRLGVRNTGNGYDNISLQLQSTHGWDARLSNTTLRLTPFNTSTFTLHVTAPPNTPATTVAAFYVNATAGGPQDIGFDQREKISIESTMTIAEGPNVRFDAPINSSFVDAGTSYDYTILVTNVGNVADNFTIPTPDRPADWGISVTPEFLELQPTQQGTLTVRLTAPGTAVVGEKAIASVNVRSKVHPSLTPEPIRIEARVSGPDLFVDDVLINSSSPYSGDPLDISVVLGNNGNKAHERNVTLRVFFRQGGVERVIAEKTYPPLFIGAQRRLVEVFPWDTAGIEGVGELIARIDVNDNVKEIDDSADSNEDVLALTIRTFDIKLTPAIGLTARPGEKLTYSEAPNVFVVRYDGNQPSEQVTIRLESEHGWLTSQSELTLALPRGAPVPIIASLDIPTLPGAAKDTLTITVVPGLRPEEILRASTITTLIDEEKPIVRSITVTPPEATLGDAVTIDAHLEDATGITAATAYITSPANETTSVPLANVGGGHWSANRTLTIAGTYRVAIEAIDAADPPNRNATLGSFARFVLSPGSAPTIKLAPGQATTIRTGTNIKLDITDRFAIGKATYAIRGVSYDLRGPDYQIDTSTFLTGAVQVNVTAENIFGVSTSQVFNFVVDNVPPDITRVTMSPERPRANEEVTLTIQTAAKVESVAILVKRDGQVVNTLNATKKGIGSFTATFNPELGDYTLDVTARDAAGNTKLADGAVIFSAKAGSPLPMPSAAWIVVAVLGLALVLRQRRK